VSRTIYEVETASQWAAGGSGWTTQASINASGGSYRYTSVVNDTYTFSVPAGTTCVLLNGVRLSQNGSASVSVDGGVQPDLWNLNDYTTATAFGGSFTVQGITVPVAWHRSLYRPIYLDPTVSHTIVVKSLGGMMGLDCAECYIAESIVPGRVTTLGHSISNGTALGSPTTQRASALLAATLGGLDDNHGYGSSNLTYDNSNTGTYPAPIGWKQAQGDAGDFVGGYITSVTVTDGGAYSTGPTIAVVSPITTGAGASLSPVLTGTSPNISVASVTINNRGTTPYAGGFSAVAFNGSGSRGAAATVVYSAYNDLSNGSNWWGRAPEVALFWHGHNDAQLLPTTDPGGGLGYGQQIFRQRMREALWRMNANSPNTIILVVGMTWYNVIAPAAMASQRTYLGMEAVCAEPTIRNTKYLNMADIIANNGGVNCTADGPSPGLHLNVYGHNFVYLAALDAYYRAKSQPAERMGW
jgi:hypothetical protein